MGPKPLHEGSGPRQVKLWFNLHGITLEENPICTDKWKELKGELMVWRNKM
jgi:hypothetical protein